VVAAGACTALQHVARDAGAAISGEARTLRQRSLVKSKEEADSARAFFAGITPLGRVGRSEETASAILFLASDASSYSTGFDLVAVGDIAQA